MPTISLNNVIAAAKSDPSAPQGVGKFKADVLPVERALAELGYLPAKYADGAFGTLTVAAYKRWQQYLGYKGSDADGIPGATSLAKLGSRTGEFSIGSAAPGGGGGSTPGAISVSQVVFSGPHDTQSGRAACEDAARKGCELLGLPVTSGWVNGMTTIALRESAYNDPRWQVNKSDSNANGPVQVDGAPLNSSRGGWQCIPSTFAANHVAGTSLNIYDRVASCAAAMRYVMGRYGVSRDGFDLAQKVQQADPNRKPRGY